MGRHSGTLKNISTYKLSNGKYTCVYIMAGICSITSKDKGLIYLPFDTKESIIEATTRSIKNMLQELDNSFSTPIVLCTFPGLDLFRANSKHATGRHPQQQILDEAMIEINTYLVDKNLDRGYTTPMLSAAIHRCHGKTKDGDKKYRHHYCRLIDGVHPKDSTLKYWAKRLQEDFTQFTFNFEDL